MITVSVGWFCSLERKDFAKFLGIFIDFNLKWKHHIDFISLKISKTIRILARLRQFVPTETLLMIYIAPLLCHIHPTAFVYGVVHPTRTLASYLSSRNVLCD